MIEFDEKDHVYLVDGILTPSVTTLIHDIYLPTQYNGISSKVLEKAADYGNKVHSLIEQWNATHTIPDWVERRSYEMAALNYYLSITSYYNIEPLSQEKCVAYEHEGKTLWAGTYDMLAKVDGQTSVIDIKTTSKYYPDYLSYQCTMYKMALEQSGITIDRLYCIHLPKKGKGRLIHVAPADPDAIIRDVKFYGKKHNAGREDLLSDGI